jgi:hypothetical protein
MHFQTRARALRDEHTASGTPILALRARIPRHFQRNPSAAPSEDRWHATCRFIACEKDALGCVPTTQPATLARPSIRLVSEAGAPIPTTGRLRFFGTTTAALEPLEGARP